MPPDRPEQSAPILSELASPSYIEIKWKPPHPNGAPVIKYEIKWALEENAPEEDWKLIPPDIVEMEMLDYGFDGRRITERDAGSKVYRTDKDGTVLEPNVRYWFIVRAGNSVGWGAWSEPSGFLTKPVKPGKTADIRLVSCGINHVSVEWDEPQCHGKQVLRYDLFAAPIAAYVRWASLSTLLLATTVDSDKVTGVDHTEPLGNAELNQETGKNAFDQLMCEQCMYIPISEEYPGFKHGSGFSAYELTGLLPGSSYFFMVRAVNCIGKGQFYGWNCWR